MGYEYICKKCQAHLDPGERCDCEQEEEQERLNDLPAFATEVEDRMDQEIKANGGVTGILTQIIDAIKEE